MEEILSRIPPVIRYINRECFEQSRRTEEDFCGLSWNFLKELDGENIIKDECFNDKLKRQYENSNKTPDEFISMFVKFAEHVDSISPAKRIRCECGVIVWRRQYKHHLKQPTHTRLLNKKLELSNSFSNNTGSKFTEQKLQK